VIAPFISSNPPDARVLFENFGITFYYAQLLEDNLKLILLMGELQGILTFDREKDLRVSSSDEGLLDACMGPLKKVLKRHRAPAGSEGFYRLFDLANAARRQLAHRFFLDWASHLQSEAGRRVVNRQLGPLYLDIRNAHNASVALRDALYDRVGFTRDVVLQMFRARERERESVRGGSSENAPSRKDGPAGK
jgi:hypothetical protein